MTAFTILILGGTTEARALAERLAADRPDWRVITSLAGRTEDPDPPPGQLRVGGYGGPNLLAAFIEAEGIEVVVDATHPFAERMAANAAAACGVADRPRLKLLRPGFVPQPGDRWRRAPSLASAAAAPPPGAHVFLALGAWGMKAFAPRDDLIVTARALASDPARPKRWRYVQGPPEESVFAEAAHLRDARAQWLVARDSGGPARAKLDAARLLGVTVLLVDRPDPPFGGTVADVDAAMLWLDEQAQGRRRRHGRLMAEG